MKKMTVVHGYHIGLQRCCTLLVLVLVQSTEYFETKNDVLGF
jgi:hypothetical protein